MGNFSDKTSGGNTNGGGGSGSSNKDTFVIGALDPPQAIFVLSWTPTTPANVLVEVNGIGWQPTRYTIVGDVVTLDTDLKAGEWLIVKG